MSNLCRYMIYEMKQYLLRCVVAISIMCFTLGSLYYFTIQIAEPYLPMIALEKSRQIQPNVSQNAPSSSSVEGSKDIQYAKEVLIFLLWKILVPSWKEGPTAVLLTENSPQ